MAQMYCKMFYLHQENSDLTLVLKDIDIFEFPFGKCQLIYIFPLLHLVIDCDRNVVFSMLMYYSVFIALQIH